MSSKRLPATIHSCSEPPLDHVPPRRGDLIRSSHCTVWRWLIPRALLSDERVPPRRNLAASEGMAVEGTYCRRLSLPLSRSATILTCHKPVPGNDAGRCGCNRYGLCPFRFPTVLGPLYMLREGRCWTRFCWRLAREWDGCQVPEKSDPSPGAARVGLDLGPTNMWCARASGQCCQDPRALGLGGVKFLAHRHRSRGVRSWHGTVLPRVLGPMSSLECGVCIASSELWKAGVWTRRGMNPTPSQVVSHLT